MLVSNRRVRELEDRCRELESATADIAESMHNLASDAMVCDLDGRCRELESATADIAESMHKLFTAINTLSDYLGLKVVEGFYIDEIDAPKTEKKIGFHREQG